MPGFFTFYERGYKPDSVSAFASAYADASTDRDHLSEIRIAANLMRMGDGRVIHFVPGLASDGVFQASRIASQAGELLPRLFTIAWSYYRLEAYSTTVGSFPFCGTFLQVTPTGYYPAS